MVETSFPHLVHFKISRKSNKSIFVVFACVFVLFGSVILLETLIGTNLV